ncbi:MAG: serine/threonine-protein kinase [Pseudomonadota bacterium]
MSDETRITGRPVRADTASENSIIERPRAVALKPGDLVVNSYRIVREIARGGMGALYEGRHDITGDCVAIKAVLEQHADDDRAIKLFEREAMALSRVRHEAVVGYRDILRDDNHRLFIIMEFVDGQPMSDFSGNATLPEAGVEKLGARLSAGLAAAHQAGVAHRDMSPKNVLLPDGDIERAVIIDFGIAKNMGGDAGTMIGDAFAGTLQYAAPEQLGLFGGRVDQRADIYALGVILAEAAGVQVDLGESIGEAALKRQHDIVMPPDMPAGLRGPLERMMKADPAHRPSSVEEAWSGTPAAETPGKMVADELLSDAADADGAPRRKRRMGLFVGLAAAVVAMIVGAAVLIFAIEGSPKWGVVVEGSRGLLQAEEAKAIIADESARADDKFDAAMALRDTGSSDNLNVALGVFRALSAGGDGRASAMVAKMYDPAFFDHETSPFSRASVTSALRWYRKADGQGYAPAAERIADLERQR